MLNRIAFALILLFWLVMNALLWRSEFRGQDELSSAVPVELVWKRILTAPDDSALEISIGQQKVGYCRWRANIGEELATGKVATEESQPEGMVERLTGYTIDVEGNLIRLEPGGRFRFEFHAGFTAAHRWKDFTVRISARPRTLEIKGSAASEDLHVTFTDGQAKWERRWPYADLADATALGREFGLSWPEDLGGAWSSFINLKDVALGLRWTARKDWLQIGSSKTRVYRLQARLFDRYQAVVVVSRVGEILRVELPGGAVLVNDALINL
ncbi:MAG: hypothetical protein FJ398_18945 [Verrucomicrobia bacterium]|nr:hypothetical protein [Verrucomicrobiota bacterium]